MKGRGGSRMPLTYFANAILNVFSWTNIMYGSNLLDLDLSSKYEKGQFHLKKTHPGLCNLARLKAFED